MSNPLEIVTEVPTENQIKNAIIQFLLLNGFLVLRVNSGAAAGQYQDQQGRTKKRFMRFCQWFSQGVTFKEGQAGVSDILAIREGCPPIAIETKRPGNMPTDAQKRFIAAWAEHGGVAIVAESVTDVERVLSQ